MPSITIEQCYTEVSPYTRTRRSNDRCYPRQTIFSAPPLLRVLRTATQTAIYSTGTPLSSAPNPDNKTLPRIISVYQFSRPPVTRTNVDPTGSTLCLRPALRCPSASRSLYQCCSGTVVRLLFLKQGNLLWKEYQVRFHFR